MDAKPMDGTAGSIIDVLMNDHQLAIELLSLYYPFSEDEIEQYWDVLEHGEAHYSVYLDDTETIYSPKYGLCFNQNVEWSASLRSRWICGFVDPFHGYVVGAGAPCELDELSSRSMIIPLSVNSELDARYFCEMQQLHAFGYDVRNYEPLPSETFAAEVLKCYPRLDCAQFKSLCESKRNVVLLNHSIWDNTVSKAISISDIEAILRGRGFASQSIQEQSSGPDRSRVFPYTLAHRVAMNVFFRDPQRFYDLSSPECSRGLIEFLWEKTVAEVNSGAPADFAIGDLHVNQVAVGACRAVIIRFPEPCGVTECHLALGVVGVAETSLLGRYFTLEWSRVQGRPEMPLTMLGEWTPDGSHLNYGIGSAPVETDFILLVKFILGDADPINSNDEGD